MVLIFNEPNSHHAEIDIAICSRGQHFSLSLDELLCTYLKIYLHFLFLVYPKCAICQFPLSFTK